MDVIEETHNMTEEHQKFNVPNLFVFQCFDDAFQFFKKPQESEDFPSLAHRWFDLASDDGAYHHIVAIIVKKKKVNKRKKKKILYKNRFLTSGIFEFLTQTA